VRGYGVITRGVVYGSPWVSWGAVGGTTAGELLTLEYTPTHGTPVAYTLRDAAGRDIPVLDLGDHFEALLPVDVADGPATLTVDSQDETGNTSTTELVILLSGTPVAPPVSAPLAGGLPRLAPHRLVRSTPVELRVTALPAALVRRTPTLMLVVRGLPGARRVRSSPHFRGRSTPARVHVVIGVARVHGARRDATAGVAARFGATVVTRRDGPALEEALLLDLL
jgi:hypothetical protein